MKSPEFSHGHIPEMSNPEVFDINDLLLIDHTQDANLSKIGDLLKERKEAAEDGVELISVPELDEAKVLFFQQHEHYLACLEAAKQVENRILSGSDPVVIAFKQANEDLQSAFVRYENALKRSYQN